MGNGNGWVWVRRAACGREGVSTKKPPNCTGRLDGDIIALLTDARPRELEMVRYTFRVKRVSLACVTHFTRHRMVSLLVPPVVRAMAEGDFVLAAKKRI